MRSAAATAAVCLLAAPAASDGSPLFELIGGAHDSGGFNARVASPGAASTYYNPALLGHATESLVLGTFVLTEQIGVTLDARDSSPLCEGGGCDIPEVFGTGPESFRHEDGTPLSNPSVPTSWLENGKEGELAARPRQGAGTGHNTRAYQILGLVNPVFGDRLVVGLYALIPLAEFTTARAFYNDEREQYFSNSLHPELYSDRMTATSLSFGAGGRVTDELSLGVSFTLSLRNTASAPVYVSDLSDLNTVLLDSDIGVQAAVSPHVGVAYTPVPELRLAATVHTPQKMEIETGFEYVLATGNEQRATVQFTHAYMPLTLAVAGDYRLGPVELVGTVTFARWSKYLDRHSERPHPDYAWRDTLTGAVGARYATGATDVFLDLAYQPSPVPAQTGRTNYVDNDRVGVVGGATHQFTLWGATFRAGAQLQGHRLLPRHVTKFDTPDGDDYYPQLVVDELPDDAVDGILGDPIPGRDGLQTNNPGFPGFGSEGWVVGGALQLAVLY